MEHGLGSCRRDRSLTVAALLRLDKRIDVKYRRPTGFLAVITRKPAGTAGGFPPKRGIGDVLESTLVSVSLLRCGSSGFDRVPETLLPLQWSPWPYLA